MFFKKLRYNYDADMFKKIITIIRNWFKGFGIYTNEEWADWDAGQGD